MKPSFALVLTQDTIALMHRTSQGWQPVGEAAVADPDLTEALSYLRRSALGLDPRGITSKLIIPNSEILYTSVLAPGPSASARRAQIRAALEGRTPYAVRDLVFDWSGSGPEVKVAVVARETLEEAEAFASQHRLGPLAFAGSPEPGQFDGEPWFGPAAAAESLLAPGEKVERDKAPVPPLAVPVPPPEPVAETAAAEPAIVAAQPDGAMEAGDAEPGDAEPGSAASAAAPSPPRDARPDEVARPDSLMSPQAAPLPDAGLSSADRIISALAKVEGGFVEGPAVEAPVATPPVAGAPFADTPIAETPVARAPVTEAPIAKPPVAETPAATGMVAPPLSVARQGIPPSFAPEPSPALPANIAPPPLARSIRAEVIAPGLEVPPDQPSDRVTARPGDAGSAPAVERLKARLAEQPIDPRRFGARAAGAGAAPSPAEPDMTQGKGDNAASARIPRPVTPLAAPNRAAAPVARPAASRVAPKAGARSASPMVTSPSIPIPRDRRVNIPGAEAASDARVKAAAEARKAQQTDTGKQTAFGSRQTARGKPKYLGLILTGLLLVLLAAVAAWSTFVSSEGPAETVPVAAAPATVAPQPDAGASASSGLATGPDAAETPSDTPDGGTPAAAQPAPARPVETSPPASADLPQTAPPARPEAPDAVAASAAPDPAAEAAAPGEVPAGAATLATAGGAAEATVVDTPVVEATVVQTAAVETAVIPQPEVSEQASRNPAVAPQDEIFLARTDPEVAIGDLIALAPPVATTDPAPAAQPLPPPFGTVYQFDANGLILPTPEGIVTPEGVRLVLGKPSRVPPARPADLLAAAPAASAQVAPAEATGAAAEAAAPVPPVSAVAGASVSGVIAAPADPVAAEPFADPALRDARPRPRPASLAPAAGDDAALPQEGDPRLTSLRPQARPASVTAEAEAASEDAAEAAAIQSAAASLAATAADTAQTSPLAIAVSRKPAPRPRDLSKAVEAAVASVAPEPIVTAPEAPAKPVAVAAAAPEPRPKATAGAIPQAKPEKPAKPTVAAKPKEDPAEVEIDEPEVASAAPDLPTKANVAKQATFRNAINLSRINLIGVYGSSSNRYALVRQPNGRYVKVSVGDRVDGGKVASISERELRYVKNGRTVTLAMPRG
jgi:hypothetical protein